MNVSMNSGEDPIGLRNLEPLTAREEDADRDWTVVRSALQRSASRRGRNRLISGLGLAASLVLVLVLAFQPLKRPGLDVPAEQTSTPTTLTAEDPAENQGGTANASMQPDMIAMSQGMERQLRELRNQVSSLPTELVVYQVELQDLIGQVDEALSLDPDANELWAQRVSLQLDLIKLYRNQLRRDRALYASL